MPTFGIISEGKTDQIVLRNILAGWLENPKIDCRPIVPIPKDAEGREGPGGWQAVFKALEAGRHRRALLIVDYVVIQLDTDVSADYGVPHEEDSVILSPANLVHRVVERLKTAIDPEFYAAHAHRIIFAISVHEIECWILAAHAATVRDAPAIDKCLEAANSELARKGLPSLLRSLKGRQGKYPPAYEAASLPFADRPRLLALRTKDPSLALFLHQLESLPPPPP